MRAKLLAALRPSCLAGLVLVVASSLVTCLALDEDHCAHRAGDLRGHAWCEERHPELPLCSRCEPAANGFDGCTANEARLECLVGVPPAEAAETSSSSTTDASTTAVTSCIPAECAAQSPSRPFCSDDDQCVPCSEAGGDEACAAVDPDRPACVTDGALTGTCVPCTGPSFCTADAPICDADLHACVPCRFHAECLVAVASACRIQTGECLPPTLVRHVDASARPGGDGSAQTPFSTIAQALNNADLLDNGTILLHDGEYTEESSIADGRVIALVAAPGKRPRISGSANGGLVTATGSGTELYLEGLTLHDNNDGGGAGLRIASGAIAHVDRTELLQNAIGIELDGGNLTLRNSIVTTRLPSSSALSIANGATADITYSTLFNTATGGVETILCIPPIDAVTVRSSIILARDTSEPSGWSCAGTVSHSAGENIPADGTADNLLVCGHPDVDCGNDPSIAALFDGLTSLRLTPAGGEVFLDVPARAPDDPTFDIDGNPRTPDRDFAGASAPAAR